MAKREDSREIGKIVAANLKEIRKNKELSLDTLASMSGVSKSMLGQIERGESSPTVNTLWKIATALHISFTTLLEDSKNEVEIIDNLALTPLYNEQNLFKLYPTFPYENERDFEMLYIILEPGAVSPSEAHDLGTEEYVIVFEGILIVDIRGKRYELPAGSAIKYDADNEHTYINGWDKQTKVCIVIYYK